MTGQNVLYTIEINTNTKYLTLALAASILVIVFTKNLPTGNNLKKKSH